MTMRPARSASIVMTGAFSCFGCEARGRFVLDFAMLKRRAGPGRRPGRPRGAVRHHGRRGPPSSTRERPGPGSPSPSPSGSPWPRSRPRPWRPGPRPTPSTAPRPRPGPIETRPGGPWPSSCGSTRRRGGNSFRSPDLDPGPPAGSGRPRPSPGPCTDLDRLATRPRGPRPDLRRREGGGRGGEPAARGGPHRHR